MPEQRKTRRHDGGLAFFVFYIVLDVVGWIIGAIVFGL
jgi:hypothetical protein